MEGFKNSQENVITLEKIVKKLRNKNTVFFVGAGLSLGSGLPSWEDLIKYLCEKNNIFFDNDIQKNPHAIDKGQYLQERAQQVEAEVDSPRDIVRLINKYFEENKPSCGYAIAIQRLLVTIAAQTSGVIFTTNYDDLLEQAAEREGIKKRVYAYPHLFSEELNEILNSNYSKNDGSLCIFKIHGTVSNGESVILSHSSYRDAYRKKLISVFTRLSDINILFLGCSFTDSYFETEYREGMGGGEWYTFYPLLSGETINNKIIESQNINVVKYIINDMQDNDQHNKNIKELFDYLSDKLDLKSPVNIGSNLDILRVRNDRTIKKIKLTKELGGDWRLAGLSAVEEIICCKEITRIPREAFFNCSSLRIIRLEAGITSIGAQAFDDCANLEKIYFGSSVNEFNSLKRLGEKAFRNCAALSSVKFLDTCGIDSIPEECFQGCISLTQVDFPKYIKKIGNNAFRDCNSLQHFNFRNYPYLSEIGVSAFLNCGALNEAYIVDSVTEIGNAAFQECMRLTMVRISANLKKIADYCFADCCELEALINLEYSKVSSVEMHAFQKCLKLRKIKLPTSCKSIGADAFIGCRALEQVEGSSTLKIDPTAFNDCKIKDAVSVD